MEGPAVRTEALARTFGDVRAVDGVDLAVERGEIYGFLGPNGAGKTTVIRILSTLLAPTSGKAQVAGFDVARQPYEVRLRIGLALQEAALDDKQTGIEILRLQGRLYGLRRSEIKTRIAAITSLVDIGDALGRRVGTYSGGMKRRLDLAAALVHNPEVLFLDEPTTGLDPVSRMRVWDEIRRLNRDLGVTIFLTTQYLEEADTLADRVGIIDHGRLVAEGTPAELKRQVGSDVIVVQVAESDGPPAEQALRGLSSNGSLERRGGELLVATEDGPSMVSRVAVTLSEASIPVNELTLRTSTLDDVFLELTGNRIRSEKEK
ncbi:MAG TPA: ATP-binding cassette domain-containing protein [Actinomycetota bacterium]|nr:ATP-binding cassette domain-containing protein [Actinomycetota bacterium]